jgi:hypothetical protein
MEGHFMRFKSKVVAITAGLLFSGIGVSSVALATGPGGPGNTVPVNGTADLGPLTGGTVSNEGISLSAPNATVRSFEATYGANTYSGWHSHHGIVIATVLEGTVMRQAGCVVSTFTKGDSFTEVGTHMVWNPRTAPARLQITQIFDASVTVFRNDEARPNCPKLTFN